MAECTYHLNDLRIGYPRAHRQPDGMASGLTARLHKGEMACLVGVNGCGKSTLLRTMAGLQPPVGGSLELMGRPLHDYSRTQLAQMVGIVLTDGIPERSLTVRELVGMGRQPYTGLWGHLTQQDTQQVDRAMERMGIGHLSTRKVSHLSDGERQKTLLAKALAQQTATILLDEPLCFLDYPSKVAMLQLLAQLAHEEGLSILLSIHDLELALNWADTLWVMGAGSGLGVGTPADILAQGGLNHLLQPTGADRQGLRLPRTSAAEILEYT